MHKSKLSSLFCAVKLITKFSSPAFKTLQRSHRQMLAHGHTRTKYCNKIVAVLLRVNSSLQWLTPPPAKPVYLQNHITLNPTFCIFYCIFSLCFTRRPLRAPKELLAANILSAGEKAKFYQIKKLIPSAVLGTSNWEKFFKETGCLRKEHLRVSQLNAIPQVWSAAALSQYIEDFQHASS